MKTRNLFSILALMLFAFSSCDNDPVYSLEIFPRNIYIAQSGNTGNPVEVLVTANAAWSATVDPAATWISVNPAQSEAIQATLDITVATANTTNAVRNGVVRVKNGDNVQAINVIQEHLNVEMSKMIGKWTMTACEDAKHMIGSEFTFNDDESKTCVAKINAPGSTTATETPGTYVLNGNIITITVPRGPIDPVIITIVIRSIDAEENTIEAIAEGYEATIEKEV